MQLWDKPCRGNPSDIPPVPCEPQDDPLWINDHEALRSFRVADFYDPHDDDVELYF